MRKLVGVRDKILKVLVEAVCFLRELGQHLVLGQERVGPRFRFPNGALQALEPLVEDIEFLLLDRKPFHARPEVVRKRAAIFLQPCKLARELLARGGGHL